jgi:hypothetical protein
MLPFRRPTLLVALVVATLAACSAPDPKGLFDPLRGPSNNGGGTSVAPSCLARCQTAASRCTLLDVPCDALCGSGGVSAAQLSCLESTACEPSGGQTFLQRCLNTTAGPLGSLCDCGLTQVCTSSAECQAGLLCLDPGGPDDSTPGRAPLFPGVCSMPCDVAGPRRCPDGFTCRKQVFNNSPLAGAQQFWCER